ncbi:MAG: carbon-monoxide dehydrogenase small subunit [Candidatus Poriferisodalaceae bacterium]|jgi:aerobic carbon-monoxide dehydrogenase small subunit
MSATHASETTLVSILLNEATVTLEVPTSELLVDTLRERQRLTGTRIGCDQAACGACTVLIDGSPRASCSTFTWAADGASVVSIEGIGTPNDLSPVQQAFAEGSAFQCGYCTPGLVLTTTALLSEIPDPDDATIKEWLSSNICRCTGYQMIIDAVRAASTNQSTASAGSDA